MSGPRAQIRDEQISEFIRQHFARVPYKQMAFNFGVSIATVYNTRVRLRLPARHNGVRMHNISVRVPKETYRRLLTKVRPRPVADYLRNLIEKDLQS